VAKKKVVKSQAKPAAGKKWEASAEAKSAAGTLRVWAWVSWLVAIALEGIAIWWLMSPDTFFIDLDFNVWILVGALVVIAILAILGSQLWKRANQHDPASRKDAFKFFVQNQLGAIVTLIAFLPLIVIILANKDMSGRDKTIAGAVGGVLMVVAVLLGISWNPPSVEENTENLAQYPVESERIIALTGQDQVFWVLNGSVYHLCAEADDVNIESEDGQIYAGTVAQARAEGMEGLTLEIEDELGDCGFEIPENIDDIVAEVRAERENGPVVIEP